MAEEKERHCWVLKFWSFKISLKVASSQSAFHLRSIGNGRLFLSRFFLEESLSAPSLPAGCIPVSSSLGTSQRSWQISPGPCLQPLSRNICAEWWCTQRVGFDLECVQGTHPEPWACQAGTAIEDHSTWRFLNHF